MRAYKAFNRDMTCKKTQYKEGETYEMKDTPVLCRHGFHFCGDLVQTIQYYPVMESITGNLYAEVEVLGDVVWEEPVRHKGCTNKIKIIRVLSDEEVLAMVDDKSNSGNRNSGNRNSGNCNSGNWNKCDTESGHFNTTAPRTIRVFNKPCEIEDWENADIPDELYADDIPAALSSASEENKDRIRNLPNFDAELFGVRIEEKDDAE